MLTKEWISEIKNLGLDQKGEMLIGLKALKNWEAFAEAYSELGVFEIMKLIEEDIEDRKDEKLNDAWSDYADHME